MAILFTLKDVQKATGVSRQGVSLQIGKRFKAERHGNMWFLTLREYQRALAYFNRKERKVRE